MERVLRKESVTKLTVSESTIFITVIPFQEEGHVLGRTLNVQKFKAFVKFRLRHPAFPFKVKYSEGIDKVEVVL